MSRNRVNNIIREHFKNMKKYSRKIIKNFDEEVIHDFRVEYKKMRAFLRMKTLSKQEDGPITVSPLLKKWYQWAGALRDLQLQQHSILTLTKATQNAPQKYLAAIEAAIKKIEKKLVALPAISSGEGKARLSENPLLDPFVKYNCGVIRTILKEQPYSDNQIHQVRKSLKDIFYTIRGLADDFDDIALSSGIPLKTEMNYFETLLDQLGEFQNKSALLQLYSAEWTKHADSRELRTVNRLISAVKKEKAALRKEMMIHFQQELPVHLDLLCEGHFDVLIAAGKPTSK